VLHLHAVREVVGASTGCLLVVFLLVWVGACGGGDFTVSSVGGAGGASGAPGTGGAAAAGTGGSAASLCPAGKPNAGSSCADEGLGCSYGQSPRPMCRDRFACQSGTWQLVSQAPVGDCNNFGSECKTAPQSGACQVVDTQCAYDADGVFCVCVSLSTSSQWRCSNPPSGNCPLALPNEGDLCTAPESCSYGNCNLKQPAVVAKCNGGHWTWELDPCT
jgi:hypothetical protein